jgi:hypothetical protein
MKRAGWLVLALVCAAPLLFAQDAQEKQQGHEMTGTIFNSKCVVQQSNAPTCDRTCTDTSGDTVFVGDSGHVMKIDNPGTAMPHMGKHVKVMAVRQPSEKEREETLRIMQLTEQGP